MAGRDCNVYGRGPNSAVPMRTIVAPSRIAASKSPLMPIESVSSRQPVVLSASSSARSRANQERCRERSLSAGGMHISPRNARRGSFATDGKGSDLYRGDTAFARLACDVHLEAHVERGKEWRALGGKPFCDPETIHGVHPAKGFRDRARLVRLDAADEMPRERPIAQRGNLREPLLQVALPEVGDAAVGGRLEQFGGVALGGSEECDRLRTPTGRNLGSRDAFAQLLDTHRQILRTH